MQPCWTCAKEGMLPHAAPDRTHWDYPAFWLLWCLAVLASILSHSDLPVCAVILLMVEHSFMGISLFTASFGAAEALPGHKCCLKSASQVRKHVRNGSVVETVVQKSKHQRQALDADDSSNAFSCFSSQPRQACMQCCSRSSL